MSSAKKRHVDGSTTIENLKGVIEGFVAQRDWAQFHSPKNLAMAIGVEAGELMDIFRWASVEDSVNMMGKAGSRRAVEDEIADVMICCLALANRTGIDLSQAINRKVRKNRNKYPVQKYKGRY